MAAPPAASNHAFSITARAAGQAIAQLSVVNREESEEGKEGWEAENSCIPGKTWKNTKSCEAPEWPECRESPVNADPLWSLAAGGHKSLSVIVAFEGGGWKGSRGWVESTDGWLEGETPSVFVRLLLNLNIASTWEEPWARQNRDAAPFFRHTTTEFVFLVAGDKQGLFFNQSEIYTCDYTDIPKLSYFTNIDH